MTEGQPSLKELRHQRDAQALLCADRVLEGNFDVARVNAERVKQLDAQVEEAETRAPF